MKKISSVFVTALVFVVSFAQTVFGADKSNKTDVNWAMNQAGKGYPADKVRHNKITHKLTNMEKNKNMTVEAGKIENLNETNYKDENLGKIEDLGGNKTVEAGKIDDLNKTKGQVSGKHDVMEWNWNAKGKDIKYDDLERKR